MQNFKKKLHNQSQVIVKPFNWFFQLKNHGVSYT